jgi:hypothetical protein
VCRGVGFGNRQERVRDVTLMGCCCSDAFGFQQVDEWETRKTNRAVDSMASGIGVSKN